MIVMSATLHSWHFQKPIRIYYFLYCKCLTLVVLDLTLLSSFFSSQPGLLGVFQKLIASKANDHQGFYLLNSIVEYMPP